MTTTSTVYREAQALAGNLASMWTGGLPVLERLIAAGGRPYMSPTGALRTLGPRSVEQLFSGEEERRQLADAFGNLTRYLAAETWFDRASRTNDQLRVLAGSPVAYFCMEFGLASWLPMYSGGLGVLAGDVLKESSDMGLPMVGVGLFYRHGFFYQHLDASGYQTEEYPSLDPLELPLVPAVGPDGKEILVEVPVADRVVRARVWQLQVGRTPLFLLDTDIPGNARQEDREITGQLYGGNEQTRIQQELILGIGGVRALGALGLTPSVYGMNEGHAAFLGIELLADALSSGDVPAALARTRPHIVYTNHTVVPAGNDIFSADLVRAYLGPYAGERGLNIDDVLGLAQQEGSDRFSMAMLAFQISGKANAVSELHAAVVAREWPGFAVEAVTNGVHIPSWTGPQVLALLDRYVPDWNGDEPSWDGVNSIPAEELARVHRMQKECMIEYVNGLADGRKLDPNAVTLVWARRFAEYKRAWFLAGDMGRLSRLVTNRERPVQIIISGKAHPRDEAGKKILQELLQRLESDAAVARHVVFVPDYNIRVARFLTMGADVWVNTPRKPLEASGTSGMKAGDNGALQLTVRDGWAAEVDWWDVGWGIEGSDDATDQEQFYEYLEQGIVPRYYGVESSGVPDWVDLMKRTMIITLSRYSTRRMMLDYVYKLYLPLLREQMAASSPAS